MEKREREREQAALTKDPRRMRSGEKNENARRAKGPGGIEGGYGALLPRRVSVPRAGPLAICRSGWRGADHEDASALPGRARGGAGESRARSLPKRTPLFSPPIYANGGVSCFCFVVASQYRAQRSRAVRLLRPRGNAILFFSWRVLSAIGPTSSKGCVMHVLPFTASASLLPG